MDVTSLTGVTSKSTLDSLTSSVGSSSSLGKDEFLQMLVTQLKYQNPLEPMDNTEFTAQLAQFSSLEELTNIKDEFSSLSSSLNSQQNLMAAALIGKEVEASGNSFDLKDGAEASLSFDLENEASSVEVKIYDSEGKFVNKIEIGEAGEGKNSIVWNGMDSSGEKVNSGNYIFSVSAMNNDGESIKASTIMSGTVSGVILKEGKTYLEVGSLEISTDSLLTIK